MTPLNIVVRNYPHTEVLKNRTIEIENVACDFPRNAPSDPEFQYTVHDLTYDISEMAIVTFLQAREAGYPITLLPIVMAGAFHHRALNAWPAEIPVVPTDLNGKKVGIRTYSQTTGLWVRGVLKDDYGIQASDITWVTSEPPFVKEYVEPSYVERTSATLNGLIRDGELIAGMTTGAAAHGEKAFLEKAGVVLVPVIPNPDEAAKAWEAQHRTIPINHMLTVQNAVLDTDPKAVRSIFRAFTQAIEQTSAQRGDSPKGRVVTAGMNDQLLRALNLAITYGLEQDLLHKHVTIEEIFSKPLMDLLQS